MFIPFSRRGIISMRLLAYMRRAPIELLVFIVVFLSYFVLMGNYHAEDGIIFWKYIFFHRRNMSVEPFFYIAPAHPAWSQIYLLFYAHLSRLFTEINAEYVGNLISALMAALSATFFYKSVRALHESVVNSLLCCLILICSYGFFAYGTTVNTGMHAIFAVNFFLYYYFSALRKGFSVGGGIMLGVAFVVSCVFYVSPVYVIPALMICFVARALKENNRLYFISAFFATSFIVAFAVYKGIYKYLVKTDLDLFNCIVVILSLPTAVAVPIPFMHRISMIIENMGSLYFGGGILGLYGGVAIYMLLYCFYSRMILDRWYKDEGVLTMALVAVSIIFVGSYGGIARCPKVMIGGLGPLSYVLFKGIKAFEWGMLSQVKRKYTAIILVVFLGLLIGANTYYRMHPHEKQIFANAAPNDVASKKFYTFLKKNTDKNGFIFYDASYVGKNFGNFIVFFSERESVTDSEQGILFLGGAMPLGAFLAENKDRYSGYWLVSTRIEYVNILVPLNKDFKHFAVFEQKGVCNGVGLYAYSGQYAYEDYFKGLFTEDDVRYIIPIARAQGEKRLWWMSADFKGGKSLVLVPKIDNRPCDINHKVLFYW